MGTCLQKYAMENPLNIAGAVFLDASLIDAGYMASNGDVSFDTDTKTYGAHPQGGAASDSIRAAMSSFRGKSSRKAPSRCNTLWTTPAERSAPILIFTI